MPHNVRRYVQLA